MGPKYLKVGAAVRYRASDVEEWLRAQEREAPPVPDSQARQTIGPLRRLLDSKGYHPRGGD